jgi:hypothetical protein
MKTCSQFQQPYSDATLNFCLSDATSPVPFEDSAESESANQLAIENEVKDALAEWKRTFINRDFNNHLNLYADELSIYHKKSNVDVSTVRYENSKLFEKYSSFNLSFSNLKTDIDPGNRRAIIVFDSKYNFKSSKNSRSGVCQTEMRWKKN